VTEATARVERLDQALAELAPQSRCAPLVAALQALRGVRLLTAVTLACELGDLRRFPKASHLMGYVGLVPSESSSGPSTHRGPITKTGNGYARRALVEAAWSYRFAPRQGRQLRRRSAGLSPEILAIAWKAQHRLHARYRRLLACGKAPGRVITAIARELAGFVWAIGQHVPPPSTCHDGRQAGRARPGESSQRPWAAPSGATPAGRPRQPPTDRRTCGSRPAHIRLITVATRPGRLASPSPRATRKGAA